MFKLSQHIKLENIGIFNDEFKGTVVFIGCNGIVKFKSDPDFYISGGDGLYWFDKSDINNKNVKITIIQ
jgi:hypothetical protein